MLHRPGQSFPCSNCQKALTFKQETSNCLICPQCQGMNYRLVLPEKTALSAEKVKEDMSIIRLGTTGRLSEKTFEVVGRVQYFFQDSYRNHWNLIFDDGQTGWLGDWAGNFSFFKEVNGRFTDRFKNVSAGKKLELLQVNYEVEMLDEHRHTYAEGEIHDGVLKLKDFITLYLYHPDGSMALVNVFKNTAPGKEAQLETFAGTYLNLSELHLQNTRNYDAWR